MSFIKILLLIVLFSAQSITAQNNPKIVGIISDSIGKPIDGVVISLLNSSNLSLLKTSFSDDKGNFEFDQLSPDTFKISIPPLK